MQPLSIKVTASLLSSLTLCEDGPSLDLPPLVFSTTTIETNFAFSACDHTLNAHTYFQLHSLQILTNAIKALHKCDSPTQPYNPCRQQFSQSMNRNSQTLLYHNLGYQASLLLALRVSRIRVVSIRTMTIFNDTPAATRR